MKKSGARRLPATRTNRKESSSDHHCNQQHRTPVRSVSQRRDYGHADMSMVDQLAVEFVCNGTAMTLNRDERIVAVDRLLGRRPAGDIARLCGCDSKEVTRIARSLDTTMPCPLCRQHAHHDGGVLSRHVDNIGRPWCPQSGEHCSVRVIREAVTL